MQVTIVGESAAVTLEDTSMISASGLSAKTYGTGGEGTGASFLGEGGNCDYTGSVPYGNFQMKPTNRVMQTGYQIGSIARAGDMETAGGGRIVIQSDSIHLNGTI